MTDVGDYSDMVVWHRNRRPSSVGVQGRRHAKRVGLNNGWWEGIPMRSTMYYLGEREKDNTARLGIRPVSQIT